MRKMMAIAISLTFLFLFADDLFAYNGPVHSKINEESINFSQLDSVLKKNLGILDGKEAPLTKGNKTQQVWKWLAYGGEAEDFGMNGETDYLRTRAYNHFHDPLKYWDEAGFDNLLLNNVYRDYYGKDPISPIIWGLVPGMQAFPEVEDTTGDWSWGKAREYYYTYHTGKNFTGNTVAVTQGEREAAFADCFRAIGQVMHLLEDTSVPLHTRNDLHIFPITKIPFKNEDLSNPVGRWTYETYTAKNIGNLDYTPDQPGDQPPDSLLTDPNPDPAYWDILPISSLFDRNQYTLSSGLPPSTWAMGLSEYSNAYFFTQDTIWEKYPHPAKEDTTYADIDWFRDAEVIDAEDGQPDNRIYIKFKDGVGTNVGHLAAIRYFTAELDRLGEPDWFYLDATCYKDYAAKLIPRAVGYSAALLDYFFRGRIGVRTAILIKEPISGDITGIEIDIRNATFTGQGQSVEPFENGHIELAYQYTPAGENAPVFGLVENIYPINSVHDSINSDYVSLEVDFVSPNNPIPACARDISFTLVFRGKLGHEEDAVVGKKLSAAYKIAYYHQPDGPPNQSNIFTVLPDGSSQSNLTHSSQPNPWYFNPAWSPDGTMLAYEEQICSDPNFAPGNDCESQYLSREIVVVDNDANVLVKLSEIDDSQYPQPDEVLYPLFSPDGKKIVAGIDVQSRLIWALAIYDLETGIGSYINDVDYWTTKDISGSGPAWRPQGDKIAYYLNREYDDISGQWIFEGDLWIINPDGTGNDRLTNDDYVNIHPSWSPDGESLVFNSDRDGGDYSDIWIMDIDVDNNGNVTPGEPRQILDCTPGCFFPVFSPDGQKIIYEQSGDIKMMDLDGPGITTITTSGDLTASLSVSPEKTLPVTISLDVAPAAITAGQPATLSWSVTNAATISIDQGISNVAADGIIEVTPGQTMTYTMTVNGQGGRLTATATVIVE